jgi:hypothetical protein
MMHIITDFSAMLFIKRKHGKVFSTKRKFEKCLRYLEINFSEHNDVMIIAVNYIIPK